MTAPSRSLPFACVTSWRHLYRPSSFNERCACQFAQSFERPLQRGVVSVARIHHIGLSELRSVRYPPCVASLAIKSYLPLR
jgi:hypothetical protein